MAASGVSSFLLFIEEENAIASKSTIDVQKAYRYLTVLLAIPLSLALHLTTEPIGNTTSSLNVRSVILWLNLASTAAVLSIQSSPLCYSPKRAGPPRTQKWLERISRHETFFQVLSVGIIGFLSFGLGIITYTSPWQVGAYMLASFMLVPEGGWGRFIGSVRYLQGYAHLHDVPVKHPAETKADHKQSGHSGVRQSKSYIIDAFRRRISPALRTTVNILVLPCFAIFWLSFLSSNFRPEADPPNPQLDSNYTALSELDVVMSMYNESPDLVRQTMASLQEIPSIAGTQPRLIIYSKREDVEAEGLKTAIGAAEVHVLSPVGGREAQTYLQHITTRWDDLATHTLFLPAYVQDLPNVLLRIEESFFANRTGMLSLSSVSGATTHCLSPGDRTGWEDKSGIVSRLYTQIYHHPCQDDTLVLLSYGHAFLASAQRIRGVDKTIYEGLNTALVDPQSWAHHDLYAKQGDSLEKPRLAGTIERMWPLLLQCNDARVADMCASLWSGSRRLGTERDCQCYDRE
ncbi:hypothetical protein ANO11243_071040 [Dothideomycetidae sp. 11243]|nr:hypothetical protein ANO11243_071040 [fungal sp. No.11243]